ncbi:MAG: AfsR/SARP family transcriptional regulator [Armatimonadota bacterium]
MSMTVVGRNCPSPEECQRSTHERALDSRESGSGMRGISLELKENTRRQAGAGSSSVTLPARVPVLICLLGNFRVLKLGRTVAIPTGGKCERLLRVLALRSRCAIPRDTLLSLLWPTSGSAMAGQSLNSAVYTLHRLLGDVLGGPGPVVHTGSMYRLNTEAGVGTDVALFDTFANAGDCKRRASNLTEASSHYGEAVALYQGDLEGEADVESLMERERLRARYFTLLFLLSDFYCTKGAYAAALAQVQLLLARDPCREDAHRMAMRCYVKLGQRAQALRQYRLCEQLLRAEFNAAPEPSTTALFEQVRLQPNGV